MTVAKYVLREVTAGITVFRDALRTMHKKVELIIVQQCQKLVDNDGCDTVEMISDDRDIFAHACNFFPVGRTDIVVLMEPTQESQTVTETRLFYSEI